MTLHEKHMELVDACNASPNVAEYNRRCSELHGFRICADFIHPHNMLRTWADLAVMDGGETRDLCCGVLFWNYTEGCFSQHDPTTTSQPES